MLPAEGRSDDPSQAHHGEWDYVIVGSGAGWLASAHFNGLSGESDPLLGNREPDSAHRPTDAFSMPRADGADRRISGLPQFVTVRGGAYFFMPGIRALRYIATTAGSK
jgi:hypothetical protein